MLHRSFKPAKCKTALKLAVSRIKLLRNKREAQVKQLKRELAKLLENGQDQTARIRVEHVVREEKTMAAYELVEIYCELMAARLPMIESQKNCPIDLKEAISSVIFATPRCSDIPELADVKKHMASKYGKEFVSAAVELRPDCGVNRLLVEKLSAKAPDGPTKIKILTAIAEEHNIKWESKSFGDNDTKASQDLLVGPSIPEKSPYVEPFQVHVPPPVHDKKGPPNSGGPSQLTPMHDAYTNSYEQSVNAAARKSSGNNSTTSDMPNIDIKSSGDGSQKMDFRDSYSENRSSFPTGRQNWNMEFKDAASAAQAAAESADRATMAAKAAAEFSNRENINRQYSSGLHSSPRRGSRGEAPTAYDFHDDKHLSSGSVNSTMRKNSSVMRNEQDNLVGMGNEDYRNSNQNVVKHAQTASTIGGVVGDDKPFTHGSQIADTYHHNNSFKQESNDLHATSIKKQASRANEDFGTEHHSDDDTYTENNYDFVHAKTDTQSGQSSSSHLFIPSDDHNDNLNSDDWTIGNKAAQDLFSTEVNTQTNTPKLSSFNDTSVVFDDSESDNDDYKFDADKKYNGSGSGLFFSSPSSKYQVDPLENTNSWSHGQNTSVKETSSDDPGSDIETDLVKSKVSRTFDEENSVLDQIANHGTLGSSLEKVKNLDTDRNPWSPPSSVGSDYVEEHSLKKVHVTNMSGKSYGYDDSPTSELSSTGRNSTLGLGSKEEICTLQPPNNVDDTETSENSHIENGTELNYGTLKGGFRNKGFTRLPYNKKTSDDVSASLGDISIQNRRLPTVRTSTSFDAPVQDKYTTENRGSRNAGSKAHNRSSDSDSYDLVTDSQEVTSTPTPRIQNEQSEATKKSGSRTPIPYFDSDDSESEAERHKQNAANVARPVSRVSRRTSASPKTGTGLSSNHAPLSEAPVTPGSRLGWKSSRVSDESSESRGGSKPGLADSEASKPISQPNRSLKEEVVNSSSKVQPSLPNTDVQDSDTPSKQKVDHVHPKLPDYDSFAAHFMSLKKGRP
ncbi:unnamed protein product [Lathyrus oleraceus]